MKSQQAIACNFAKRLQRPKGACHHFLSGVQEVAHGMAQPVPQVA
ncbi:MAG TPA: hypothetical protein VGN60_05085 [Devosia sp.]|nr:hypothetical protein [Devosia sp.]